jgi:hypothetical protein
MLDVLVPVLGRPARAERLTESLREATKNPFNLVFLCSPEDTEEIEACREVAAGAINVSVEVMTFPAGHGDWARKINCAFSITHQPFVLLGADDLRFHSGWDEVALEVAEASGAGLIGTNDLGNATVMRGLHSTHPLIRRTYAERGTVDDPSKVLHEGYGHQWVDTELCETAKARGEWVFAKQSHVEHLHYMWGKSDKDAVYEKAQSTTSEDASLFIRRLPLWTKDLRRRERAVGHQL